MSLNETHQPIALKAIHYDTKNYQVNTTLDISRASKLGKYTWIQVCGELQTPEIRQYCEAWGFHPLLTDIITSGEQRSIADTFEKHLSFSMQTFYRDSDETLQTQTLFFVVTDNLLFTFHPTALDLFTQTEKHLSQTASRLRNKRIDYLFYILTDAVIDDTMKRVEDRGDHIEDIEDNLIENPAALSLQVLYKIKREGILLRKTLQPTRDSFAHLIRHDFTLIQPETYPYIQDVSHATLRILDILGSQREIIASMLDIYLSSLNNKMNETMKILTIFSTIFIPLTFIAGLYGMNFQYMPELKYRHGYFIVLGVMGVIAVSLLGFFRRKKWL